MQDLFDALQMALPLIKENNDKENTPFTNEMYEKAAKVVEKGLESQLVRLCRIPDRKGRVPRYGALVLPSNIHVEIHDYQEEPFNGPVSLLSEDPSGDKFYLITKTWED